MEWQVNDADTLWHHNFWRPIRSPNDDAICIMTNAKHISHGDFVTPSLVVTIQNIFLRKKITIYPGTYYPQKSGTDPYVSNNGDLRRRKNVLFMFLCSCLCNRSYW